MKFSSTLIILSSALVGTVSAHEYQSSRPDSHAPISVMGDHTHEKGDWMASYRFMFMDMDGMRSGTDSVDASDVFAANYTVTPTKMSMNMHMFGVMHAPSDKFTFMAMLPYLDTKMDHTIFPMAAPLITLNGGETTFRTRSKGFGDFKLSSLIKIHTGENDRAHLTLGVSIPTGSIGEKDKIPGPGGRIDRQLPAPMQLGSGSTDLLGAFTYGKQLETWSYGMQGNTVIRLEDNSHGYQLGDKYEALGWLSWLATPSTSLSITAYAKTEGELSGTQKGVAQTPPFAPSRRTVTTAFGENYGGDQAGVRLGINFLGKAAGARGHRFALEVDLPLYRDLNGFQLETDSIVMLGWQKAW